MPEGLESRAESHSGELKPAARTAEILDFSGYLEGGTVSTLRQAVTRAIESPIARLEGGIRLWVGVQCGALAIGVGDEGPDRLMDGVIFALDRAGLDEAAEQFRAALEVLAQLIG